MRPSEENNVTSERNVTRLRLCSNRVVYLWSLNNDRMNGHHVLVSYYKTNLYQNQLDTLTAEGQTRFTCHTRRSKCSSTTDKQWGDATANHAMTAGLSSIMDVLSPQAIASSRLISVSYVDRRSSADFVRAHVMSTSLKFHCRSTSSGIL